jgi:hypothetical protein
VGIGFIVDFERLVGKPTRPLHRKASYGSFDARQAGALIWIITLFFR